MFTWILAKTGILTFFFCVYYQPFRRAPEPKTYVVCPSSTPFRSVHTETACQYVVTGFASLSWIFPLLITHFNTTLISHSSMCLYILDIFTYGHKQNTFGHDLYDSFEKYIVGIFKNDHNKKSSDMYIKP